MEIPLLYKASHVVFAVPETQVSVEVNSKSLQNILFVRLNENFDCK